MGQDGWQQAPAPIDEILQTPWTPAISLSPDRAWMAELERPALPPIDELAAPEVRVAGIKLNPSTHGPAQSRSYRALRLRSTERAQVQDIALPEDARINDLTWSPDSQHLMVTRTVDDGIELWVVSVATGQARALSGPVLNAVYGNPCDWLSSGDAIVCKVVPDTLGAPPEAPRVQGPRIEDNDGRATPARTYTNLLSNTHDEALFEHYLTSAIDRFALDGTVERIIAPDLIDEVYPSPDAQWLLVKTLHTPWSYHVPAGRFPVKTTAVSLTDGQTIDIADLPLADSIPIAYGSVRTGRRSIGWRSDAPATLYMVEALDGGDAGADAEQRDRLSILPAPFNTEPQTLWESTLRFGGVSWGRDDFALVSEWWFNNRQERVWAIDPSSPDAAPRPMVDRNYQDAYADPGSALFSLNEHNAYSLLISSDGTSFYRKGRGASPEGVYPFLDRISIETGESTRIWQAQGSHYESVVTVLDADAERFITRRESQEDPPNYMLRTQRRRRPQPLTRFGDPVPQLAGIQKEVVTYSRADGVQLSATLYTPAGWSPKDGPLPTILWAYPAEHKDRSTASQVTTSPHTFSRPYGSSILFMLTQGYAVMMSPKMPIIGEGDIEPNDNYVEQLIAGAEAAVGYVVERGVADPNRLAIGGHSYGAFTTANLLAHTDLFQAGIARSGAYNRSLTPFGFQSEQRTYWEGTSVYMEMSPFTHAANINEPLLLIHGAEDTNSGTWPMQSERMYEALKGLGAVVRWVELPHEGHGYRSYQAVGHTHYEMARWLELHLAPETDSQ